MVCCVYVKFVEFHRVEISFSSYHFGDLVDFFLVFVFCFFKSLSYCQHWHGYSCGIVRLEVEMVYVSWGVVSSEIVQEYKILYNPSFCLISAVRNLWGFPLLHIFNIFFFSYLVNLHNSFLQAHSPKNKFMHFHCRLSFLSHETWHQFESYSNEIHLFS